MKKLQFCEYAKKRQGLDINPDSLFDVQAKRLHEYKRQLMNALYIISLYNELKENPNKEMTPKTFIFGAKAAPGYYFAKQVIKLICALSADIRKNPVISKKLNVVYMEDYCVLNSGAHLSFFISSSLSSSLPSFLPFLFVGHVVYTLKYVLNE